MFMGFVVCEPFGVIISVYTDILHFLKHFNIKVLFRTIITILTIITIIIITRIM